MIPFNKPSFGKEEEETILRVLRSGYLTTGPEVKAFEKEFAEFIGAPYVLGVDNCTNALFLALEYDSKGLVGCPAMTFASVAHVIKQTGHQLAFIDEYKAGDAYLLKNTEVWDCAHRIERGMYKKGQIMCFSFYPNKVLCSCEGGAIATDDKDFYEWAKLACNNGRNARTSYDYDIDFVGWKMNMTDMQAAIAREQLKKLDGFNARREEIRQMYKQAGIEQLNDWHYLYVIKVENRKKFMEYMLKEGIETSYHYKPLYDQPAYQEYLSLPYTESIKDKIVTIPLYPSLTNQEVEHIIKTIKTYQTYEND